MKLVSTEKTDVNMSEITAQIEPEQFEKAVAAAYLKQRKNISMPGFRKGKVPRGLIEKTYGEGVFYEDAINSVLSTDLNAIIEEAGLDLVDSPKVEANSVSKETGAELKIVCVTRPEIHMDDYLGIEAEKPEVTEITDEIVDSQLDQLLHRNARMVSIDDRAAEMGDEVSLDFEGFFGDTPFEGGKGEDYSLKLGSGQFIPGFEEQVAGHEINEPFDVTVTFPEGYQVEEYSGKEAVFKCLIHTIMKEELPELDDDFAKDASEFDTLDELKADTRKKLEENAKNSSETAFKNAVIDKLIEKVDDPIPHCMFEQRADTLLRNYAAELQQQGVSLDMYLQYTGMTQDSLKASFLDRAEAEIKLRLALETIAAKENIEVTDEEFEAEVASIAEKNRASVDDVKRLLPQDEIRKDILVTKALDLVVEKAVPVAPKQAEESKEETPSDTTEEA